MTTGVSLTTVVLVSLVPAVVHTVTLEKLRQALGDIPTGEIAKGALDILSIPLRNCDEERGEKVNIKALQKVVFPQNSITIWSSHPGLNNPLHGSLILPTRLTPTIFQESPLQYNVLFHIPRRCQDSPSFAFCILFPNWNVLPIPFFE